MHQLVLIFYQPKYHNYLPSYRHHLQPVVKPYFQRQLLQSGIKNPSQV